MILGVKIPFRYFGRFSNTAKKQKIQLISCALRRRRGSQMRTRIGCQKRPYVRKKGPKVDYLRRRYCPPSN
eukprot:06491.XXX_148080_148292_1 [CDS] Oithona nana genome sequencing.